MNNNVEGGDGDRCLMRIQSFPPFYHSDIYLTGEDKRGFSKKKDKLILHYFRFESWSTFNIQDVNFRRHEILVCKTERDMIINSCPSLRMTLNRKGFLRNVFYKFILYSELPSSTKLRFNIL